MMFFGFIYQIHCLIVCLLLLKTGSGKTYTMGTNYSGDGTNGGIIPNVMEDIFRRVDTTKDSSELLIRVSFIEVITASVFVI